MPNMLEKELITFKKELPNLLNNQGKHVLIHRENVEGVFDTYEDAITAGYEKFGLETFLVKKISASENVAYFSRNIDLPCPV